MKLFQFIAFSVLLTTFFALAVSCATVKGNGESVSSEIKTGAFEEIALDHKYSMSGMGGGKALVRIRPSEEFRVVLNTDSNLAQSIRIGVENKTLRIDVLQRISKDFAVDVYCPAVFALTIQSKGAFETEGAISSSILKVNINGAGAVNGNFECEALWANINGSGSMKIKGNAKDLNVAVNGAGVFDGADFFVNKSFLGVNGAGTIKCSVSEELMANISGAGTIRYNGNPKINATVSGVGSIKQM